jgi:hypothetical protein
MAKKKVYRFLNHCQGKKRAESADYPVTVFALATVLARRSGRSSALPYPPSSAAILPPQLVFATGRFFVVNF